MNKIKLNPHIKEYKEAYAEKDLYRLHEIASVVEYVQGECLLNIKELKYNMSILGHDNNYAQSVAQSELTKATLLLDSINNSITEILGQKK